MSIVGMVKDEATRISRVSDNLEFCHCAVKALSDLKSFLLQDDSEDEEETFADNYTWGDQVRLVRGKVIFSFIGYICSHFF